MTKADWFNFAYVLYNLSWFVYNLVVGHWLMLAVWFVFVVISIVLWVWRRHYRAKADALEAKIAADRAAWAKRLGG